MLWTYGHITVVESKEKREFVLVSWSVGLPITLKGCPKVSEWLQAFSSEHRQNEFKMAHRV